MSEEEQRAWVEAARQGDERAFAQIFNHYHVHFFHLVCHLLGDADEAEDVVQQTFIKAFRSLQHMRDPGSLDSWLRRILYTTTMDVLRSRKRRRELPLDDKWRQRQARAVSPERDALLQEQVQRVQEALRQMPPRYRAYIILRELEGLTYEEIAETLGKPITTVRVALFRARERLREILRQLGEEDIP
jgi:RNA polymerase sigma-70 factor (ECF subfamily)